MMFEKTIPVMKSTLSRLTRNLSAVCLATSGLCLVVGDDHFSRQAAQLATVELLDRQVEAVADVDAEAGAGAGERGSGSWSRLLVDGVKRMNVRGSDQVMQPEAL
jgi:hypothetical protein